MKSKLTTMAMFRLDRACEPIREAYGNCPYLVGSTVDGNGTGRDVDVRLILPDDQFEALFPTIEIWQITCLGIGSWLESSTNLPIDFQIQKQSIANEKHQGGRNPLGLGSSIRMYAGGGDATAWPKH